MLEGNRVVEERLSTGGVTKHFRGPGIDEVLGSLDPNGTVSYYVRDHLGSIRQTTSSSGQVALARAYDPWGTGEGAAGYSFTGREWDSETGLYFYVYVFNAPVAVTDPFGLHPRSGPCDRACEIAGTTLNPGNDVGGAICCNGTMYACYWKSNDFFAFLSSKADPILEDCTKQHERIHFYQVKACPCTGISRPLFDMDDRAGECIAYHASMYCLQRKKKECGGDPMCNWVVDAKVENSLGRMLKNCPKR
jgi:hypothetical protein